MWDIGTTKIPLKFLEFHCCFSFTSFLTLCTNNSHTSVLKIASSSSDNYFGLQNGSSSFPYVFASLYAEYETLLESFAVTITCSGVTKRRRLSHRTKGTVRGRARDERCPARSSRGSKVEKGYKTLCGKASCSASWNAWQSLSILNS